MNSTDPNSVLKAEFEDKVAKRIQATENHEFLKWTDLKKICIEIRDTDPLIKVLVVWKFHDTSMVLGSMVRDRDYPGNPLLSDLKFHQTYLSRLLRDFEVTYYLKEWVDQASLHRLDASVRCPGRFE